MSGQASGGPSVLSASRHRTGTHRTEASSALAYRQTLSLGRLVAVEVPVGGASPMGPVAALSDPVVFRVAVCCQYVP